MNVDDNSQHTSFLLRSEIKAKSRGNATLILKDIL